MALQFNPYDELRRRNEDRPDINRVAINPILQGLQMFLENKRQKDAFGLAQNKDAREAAQFKTEYGFDAPAAPRASFDPSSGSMTPMPPQPMLRPSNVERGYAQRRILGTPTDQIRSTLGLPEGYTPGTKQIGAYADLIKAQTEPKGISYQKAEYNDPRGRARIGRWNPQAGIIEKTPNDEYAPQTARGETAGNLRKEFIDRPEVKEFVAINTQVKSMDSMLQNALAGNMNNRIALDQALITMYNKLSDPSSVVRESEYARTPENLPLINRISGAIQKVQAGGAGLTNEDRQALVVGAKIIANERGKTYSTTRSGYTNLAGQMSLDPSLITATMPDFSPYAVNSPTSAPPPVGQKPKTIKQNGYTYTYNESTGQYE